MKSTGEKSPEKILSKRNSNSQLQYLIKWKNHEEPTWEFEENIRNQIQNLLTNDLEQKTNQNEKQVEPMKILQRTVQQSFKHPNCSEELLFNKQREMTKKYCNAYPQSGDEIDSVQLILTQEDCIFEIKWKSRFDGVQPISDFYQYDQFKVVAPMLFMDFLEICILGFEKKSDIQFIAPGKDNIERTQLIKSILLQNSNYVDTNKNQLEEVKVNEQANENYATSKKNTKITFMQSDQKQKQLIQPQSNTEPQDQEQQQNENSSQQNNNQSDEQLLEDKQSDQQQLEQKEQNMVDQNKNQNYEEQIEQESISLEQQQLE
ncbi:unnamed protein product [Paramecium octaurelia]|uniref:Chromo domain-containing protein n=1 Tax=Paramecium octaurelia TaxID=43137 RepID=A0A8S1U4A3_PAROT|nr:unnamed protein product [Paramecium octaurelia]